MSDNVNFSVSQFENISEVMDEFDFEMVHDIMEHIGWKWVNSDGRFSVPEIKDMKRRVRELIFDAIAKNTTVDTGGFRVTADGDCLSIEFILERSSNY